ncbi:MULTISPECIES: FAD-dependent oxidoreductase [unclassified Haladaptatus]|uniref:NAD(P)/FAD-dependent oxidoreductase n=1 Tax=unclassified Haladaptatus TaxID=2622732 RepID=UPI00209C4A0D|nr:MULTISPECIES: FAD-dependent oxidoreductase [unclassified Haladaptatus]MCO8245919.1 FAD-dependent oxidoreductase [Haladaptatus sp. AB643]MCO8254461.1 FAD-dependent oxidoreductase [Haladaptatus sp. AB618]
MQIAVLGAGYAGLALARKLEKELPDETNLVVVEETGHHLVQHELHRVIRRPSLADQISIPLTEVLDCEVHETRVESVDPNEGSVVLADDADDELDYDYAAVCLGAETAFYDLPGVEEHAIPLKRLEHAHEIREGFLDADGGRVVVGGAGLSGVQVAGELAALADEELMDVELVLLEQFDHVAPAFPANFQEAVREQLEARDIEIRTGTAVERADDGTITLADGETLDYDEFVWTGGIRGSDAMDGDRARVDSTLRLGDGTFVLGDAARVVDGDGEAVPASAQSAVREARVVADNIVRLVEEEDRDDVFDPRLDQFTFNSPGWLVSVGDGAVAQVGPTVVTGTAAKALKATVGAGYLSSVGAVRNAVDLIGEELGD